VRDRLAEQEVEVFLPTITRWSRWRDRKKEIDWPLFPGYCFARFDAADRLGILKCDGVVAIVGAHGTPSPIPDEEIDGVRQLVESELSYDPCPLIKEGTRVVVTHGPLKGVMGRLIRKGPHARLLISVDLIGHGASVQVDAADVSML
jgi:transcriptional antiterminator NusG